MKRVGMWGSSYGGLLTTTSLFTYPGVYKAGVAGAPATSLFHARDRRDADDDGAAGSVDNMSVSPPHFSSRADYRIT